MPLTNMHDQIENVRIEKEMEMTRIHARALTVAIGALVLMIASPSYSQNGIIFGCIGQSSGQIRIVSDAEQCRSTEASLSWNQAGIRGPQGIQGPQGPAGVAPGICSDSDTNTNILFPFVTNQAGFDTGMTIANTTADPFGTIASAGSCTLNFFGSTIAGNTPAAVSTGNIAAGATYTNVLQTIAPNFQGYVIAACNFPLAHGFSFISDIGARNLATSVLPLNICSPRVAPQ